MIFFEKIRYGAGGTPLTLNVRNILVTLREMKELCTRVRVHIKTIFKAAITNLWGGPKASARK